LANCTVTPTTYSCSQASTKAICYNLISLQKVPNSYSAWNLVSKQPLRLISRFRLRSYKTPYKPASSASSIPKTSAPPASTAGESTQQSSKLWNRRLLLIGAKPPIGAAATTISKAASQAVSTLSASVADVAQSMTQAATNAAARSFTGNGNSDVAVVNSNYTAAGLIFLWTSAISSLKEFSL